MIKQLVSLRKVDLAVCFVTLHARMESTLQRCIKVVALPTQRENWLLRILI